MVDWWGQLKSTIQPTEPENPEPPQTWQPSNQIEALAYHIGLILDWRQNMILLREKKREERYRHAYKRRNRDKPFET